MKYHATALLLFALAACQPGKKNQTDSADAPPTANAPVASAPLPYDLSQPTERHKLPGDLREISGLSYYKANQLACVQDELGVIFYYDLKRKTIANEQVFGKNGDYEGIELVNGKLYVLRSDGELYESEPSGGGPIIIGGAPQTRHIKMDIPGKNDIEGLGYDPQLKALLLATKEGKGTDKIIYYYSLPNKTLFKGLVLKQADIQAFGQKGSEFKPSGIAVHPTTRDYYVLSSASHQLAVFTPAGKVKSVVPLDANLLPQPEGICFAPNGTLYIASEGDNKKGLILAFEAN